MSREHREIKFRAWCEDQKRMFSKVLVGNISDPDSGDYTAHCICRDGEWYNSDEHDNVIFEQFTGLQDCNGVEIYEGDIVDLGQTVNGCSEFSIAWCGVYLRWIPIYHAEMKYPRAYEYDIVEFFHIDTVCDEGLKVIGNIHEQGDK